MPDLARPWALLLFFPLLFLAWRRIRASPLALPQAIPRGSKKAGRIHGLPSPPWLVRMLALVSLVAALAGPRVPAPLPPGEGIAILFALDLSRSMETLDMGGRSRLAVAREEMARFIRSRPQDLIGLVTFGEEAVTRVPPTPDHQHLLKVLGEVGIATGENGTAMGVGLGLAAQRASEVPSPSRVVILLTDGRNNSGAMEPIPVSRAARALGVRVHAVGVGAPGGEDPLDEPLLQGIARDGGGRYFRARDQGGFTSIMAELDCLERGPIPREPGFTYSSLHGGFLISGLLLLLLECMLWVLPGGRIL